MFSKLFFKKFKSLLIKSLLNPNCNKTIIFLVEVILIVKFLSNPLFLYGSKKSISFSIANSLILFLIVFEISSWRCHFFISTILSYLPFLCNPKASLVNFFLDFISDSESHRVLEKEYSILFL